ncbi:MAG: Nif3-like dinuclear metal center hexameric protein [Nanoarchaeota archaeon]
MVSLNAITTFLDNYLMLDNIEDASYNGLQVEGKQKVSTILLAVDAGIETFLTSVAKGADMIILHHGLFWQGVNPCVKGSMKDRLKILLENDISLYTAHLPLDCHEQIGHNAEFLHQLGAKKQHGFYSHQGKDIGWIGTYPQPRTQQQVLEEVADVLKISQQQIHSLFFGTDAISKIAVCCGAAGRKGFLEAKDAGADLYITGEPTEIYHDAKDAGMNVLFTGHHASETLGLKALAVLLDKKFDIHCKFIDIPTGL